MCLTGNYHKTYSFKVVGDILRHHRRQVSIEYGHPFAITFSALRNQGKRMNNLDIFAIE